jgi:hypothetical protein
MQKNRLLVIPFLVGLAFFVYSWFQTYPLSLNSGNDYIYYHISVFYWLSIPLLLGSMLLLAFTTKNQVLRWALSVGMVLTIYSLAYFYITLPSSDSQYFRGLTEYFINTKNLDPTVPNHQYYQWPSFFVLGDIATSISGLPITSFEILLYTVIGLLLATGLYAYASKKYVNSGFLMVAIFFIAMTYFFNYQAVPFSLAFSLLLLFLVLEAYPGSRGLTATKTVLFLSILFTHSFVPLFIVLYFFIRFLLDKTRRYGLLFLASSSGYLVVQLTLGRFSFFQNIFSVMTRPAEYSSVVQATLVPVQIPLDTIAQMFSRFVTVGSLGLCFVCFLILLLKRQLRSLDKGILLTGIVYSCLGLFLYTLGTRAIAIAFIPIALGVVYVFATKFRRYVVAVSLILIVLFVFVPVHQSFSAEVQFQTRENYLTENFFLGHYTWEPNTFVLADYRVVTYLDSTAGIEEAWFVNSLNQPDHGNIVTVLYTVGLAKDLSNENSTLNDFTQQTKINIVYDSGQSLVGTKAIP